MSKSYQDSNMDSIYSTGNLIAERYTGAALGWKNKGTLIDGSIVEEINDHAQGSIPKG